MSVQPAKTGISRIKPHMIGGANMWPEPAAILLNSNESVYGPSPLASAAARAAASDLGRYFEFADAKLAPVIGAHFGLDANRITVGQGSDDLLARVARAYLGPGDELIRSANGYLKVPNYAYANDAEVISVPDDDFVPSVDRMIAALTDRTRIVYLANPENPAGTYLSGPEIRRLHAALPEHVLLVLDCAYEEYVDAADYEPGHVLAGEASNVVLCRTFSKIYGMAGAWFGWLYGPEPVVDALQRIALTFPVASATAAAVRAALEDEAHIRMVFEANKEGRDWLSRELTGLGFGVVPSQTNFVLARVPAGGPDAADIDAGLRRRGIAIRRLASPAFADYIRITIGFPEDLKRVVTHLSDLIGEV